MENTAESMYKYFLFIIRKERTTVVSPSKWNEWINNILLNWVKTKLPENEFNQKRIDDLEVLHISTDGIVYDPIPNDSLNIFSLPINSKIYPQYQWGLSAAFNLYDYSQGQDSVKSSLNKDKFGNNYTGGKILRTDNKVFTNNNPFRQPDYYQVYFEVRGNKVYLRPDDKIYNCMILDYYTYPDKIEYKPGEDGTAGSFQLTQNQEIVELAARKYLERITDPRHQTYTMEQMSTPG